MESSLTTATVEPEERDENQEAKSNTDEGEQLSSDTPMDILITSAPGDIEDDDEEEPEMAKGVQKHGSLGVKYVKRFQEEYSSGQGEDYDTDTQKIKMRRPSSTGKSRAQRASMERLRTGQQEDKPLMKMDTSVQEEKQRPGSEGNKPKQAKSEGEDQESKTASPRRIPLPPNPLLPRKNIQRADVPRSGTDLRFMKIPPFLGTSRAKELQGQDYGKYPKKAGISVTEYPPHTTLNSVFFGWMNRIDQLASGAPIKGLSNTYEEGSPIVFRRDAGQSQKESALPQENKAISTICDVRKLIKVTGESSSGIEDEYKRVSSIPPVFSDDVKPYYTPKEGDHTLIFDSRFESGNLAIALKVSDTEYNLLLQNDINTQGHTQWFFFRVGNTFKGESVRFNILNLCKSDSLYNHGMKVLVFSLSENEKSGLGWHRDGKQILYYMNGIRRDNVANYKSYYTLTFTYKFKHTNDMVYFAYSLPYTYSDLQEYLLNICSDPKRQRILSRKTLCSTIAGNKCELLTFTEIKSQEDNKKKKGVVISGRVHPGETVGSWMMQGVMELLASPTSYEAYILRKHFIFKIIPMVNPDGVINGNYRCSLAGCDLNRRWKLPSKVLHPVVYQIKRLLRSTHREREVALFCDLHGHSRNKNVFMYGCSDKEKPEETRMFPYIMNKLCPFFSFKCSKFGVQKSKESTARITMWRELKIPCVYTMEASFCGPSEGEFAGTHFTEENLKQIGKDLCRTLLYYCDIEIIKQPKPPERKDLEEYKNPQTIKVFDQDCVPGKGLHQRIKNELLGKKDLIMAGEGGESSGSDQCPSEDNFEEEEIRKVLPRLEKKAKKDAQQKKMINSMSRAKAPVAQPRPQAPVIKPQPSPQERKKPEPVRDRKPSTLPVQPSQNINPTRNVSKRTSVLDGPSQSAPPEKSGKKAHTMKDAWTQTDKSDIRYIKMKMGLLRYTPRSLSNSIQRTINSGSRSLRTHHQKMNTSYNTSFTAGAHQPYQSRGNTYNTSPSHSPPHRAQHYSSGHYSDTGGNAGGGSYPRSGQSANPPVAPPPAQVPPGSQPPDGYFRVFELHFPKVKPGQQPPAGQYPGDAAQASQAYQNQVNAGPRGSKGFEQISTPYRTATPSDGKQAVVGGLGMHPSRQNANSSFDLKGQVLGGGRSVSPVNRVRQQNMMGSVLGGATGGIPTASQEYTTSSNAAAQIIKRRNSTDKYKTPKRSEMSRQVVAQLNRSFVSENKARTPGNKLPEISPTKAGSSKPGSSKQVLPEKQQSSLILESSDPQFKLKNQVQILNSSNTNSPIHKTGYKRTSHQTGGSGSKAIIPSKANILSSGNQPLSGVVIPSSSSNLGEEITEALLMAGVTEEGAAGVKQELMKKAGLDGGGSSSRGKKAFTSGGSIYNTQGQVTSREEKKQSAGSKRNSGSCITGQGSSLKKMGSGMIGSSMGATPTTKGKKGSVTSASLSGTGLSSSSFASGTPSKKGSKKKKKSDKEGTKNVNINIINVQNDFQISNQIIIQSGGAPPDSAPSKVQESDEQEKKP